MHQPLQELVEMYRWHMQKYQQLKPLQCQDCKYRLHSVTYSTQKGSLSAICTMPA